MSDLARQARLPPPFANTPVKPRPTIVAASHERGCDVDRRVLIVGAMPRYRCAVKIDFGIMPWIPLVPSTTWVT